MTSKERVLTAIGLCEPDRVPVNYRANTGIDSRLTRHYGLTANDDEGLRNALGVDFRAHSAQYIGSPLHEEIPERRINLWGQHTRWIEHAHGGYWDYCDFPLKDADEEKVAHWPMPSPDDFDYEGMARACREASDFCVVLGGVATSSTARA